MFWYQEVVGYDRGMQLEQLREVTANLVGMLPAMTRMLEPGSGRRVIWAPARYFLLLGLVAAGVCAVYLVPRGQRRSWVLTTDQARAARLYRSVLRRFRRIGVNTSGVTAEELLAHWPVQRDGETLREVIQAYNEARFGGRRMPRERYVQLLRRLRGAFAKRSARE